MAIKITCVYEPRGEPHCDNLEGFSLGGEYWAEERKSDKIGKFWRVWPEGEVPGGYYETCGPRAFKKCFEPIGCNHEWSYSHHKAGLECAHCDEFKSDFT